MGWARSIPFTVVGRIWALPGSDPDKLLRAALNRLTACYDFSQRDFGQGVSASEIAAGLLSVSGIRAAKIDELSTAEGTAAKLLQPRLAGFHNGLFEPAQILVLKAGGLKLTLEQ